MDAAQGLSTYTPRRPTLNPMYTARKLLLTVLACLQLVAATTASASAGFGYDDPRSAQLEQPAGLLPTGGDGFLLGSYSGPVRSFEPGRSPTVAVGDGKRRLTTDPRPVHEVLLYGSGALDALPGGGFLIAGSSSVAEVTGNSIRRIEPEKLARFIGTSDRIATRPGGGYVLSTHYGEQIYEIDEEGDATAIAGTDHPAYTPDGSLAAGSPISFATDVAIAPDGGILFSELGPTGPSVREIKPDGTLTTVAGGNIGDGDSGDGGPATEATFTWIHAIAVEDDGSILVGDDTRVRRVGTDGIIRTVAGTDQFAYNDDGIDATTANLSAYQLATTDDGGFLIGDLANQRVRKVSPDGIITTVGGMPAPAVCPSRRFNGIQGGSAGEALEGGELRDLIRGEFGDDVIDGGDEADCLAGGLGSDTISGGSADDAIDGDRGDDGIDGGEGADALKGRGQDDLLRGDSGADRVGGGPGDDRLEGGIGADRITGQGGADLLAGGRGDDVLDSRFYSVRIGPEIDTVDCGPGIDVVTADPDDVISPNCEKVDTRG